MSLIPTRGAFYLLFLLLVGCAIANAKNPNVGAMGRAFLKANQLNDGVTTTKSGLQYQVIAKGNSEESPRTKDTVTLHYHGTFISGEVFDSSIQRGRPATLDLSGTILGWTEGIPLMSIGDKFRFYIPSKLAYRSRRAGSIPPYSVLIFDIELLGIE